MLQGKLLGDRYKLKWMPGDESLTLGIWAKNPVVPKNQTGGFGRYRAEAFVCKGCKKLVMNL